MNSILMSSLSPTQQRDSKKLKTKTIESKVWDDNEKEFPIEITYDYYDCYGWDRWEVSVVGFTYSVNGTLNMSDATLHELVKDIIREEECAVTFN